MSKMGWLHFLIEEADATNNQEELEKFLKEKGFKNTKIAAREFLKAYTELRDKAKAVGIKAEERLMI
tara:strand:+ start:208 stop:408 length:201 start_codon:yes stop_codon:yes gene_type:complete